MNLAQWTRAEIFTMRRETRLLPEFARTFPADELPRIARRALHDRARNHRHVTVRAVHCFPPVKENEASPEDALNDTR